MDGKRLVEEIPPYRGLKPFDTEHADLFFGRERIVQDIRNKLHQNNPLLVIGSSGSGKSSIIKAGLIPVLEEDKEPWNIFPPIKPGNSLLEKLVETFEEFFISENGPQQLRKLIHSNQSDLCQIEDFFPNTKNHLLIIDQFEELFTILPKNERQHFIELLAKILVKPPVHLKLLLAMRADFLEICLQYSTLTQIVQTQTIFIPPLDDLEWKKIINEPAERADYFIGPGLQDEILKDLRKDVNCLALLQFILFKLWEKSDHDKRLITLASYLEAGGLLGALNYYIDLFFDSLSSIEKTLLKKIFLKLVKTGIVKDVRQRQLKERLLELVEDNQNEQNCIATLLQKLLDEQLIIQEEDDGKVWIDLAHDQLIFRWQKFTNWQQETRRERQIIAPLENALLKWNKNPNKKNLATPEILNKIIHDQRTLNYLETLDSSIRVFYQESIEHRKPLLQSSQMTNGQLQEDRRKIRQDSVLNLASNSSISRNITRKKEDGTPETLEQKEDEIQEISEQKDLNQKGASEFQEAKEILKKPQENPAIFKNIFNIYEGYILPENQANYKSAIMEGSVERISKLQEMDQSQACKTVKKEHELEIIKDSLIDFAIITAIKPERLAVLKAFEIDEDKDRVRKGSRTYWYKRLFLKDGQFYEIIVAQALDMANVNAAILTNDTLHHWKPGAVLMVGIAATAKPETKQHLGNLVVGKEVYYYETGKLTAQGKLPEPKQIPVDATLLDRAQALPDSDFSILPERPDSTDNLPEVELGVIASGDKVIADAAERDAIAAANRKIMAIEMEGYGVISAAWQSCAQVRCLVIRALCDYADSNKHDKWHAYAAAVAAGYTKHFLLDEPLEPRNLPESTNL